MEDIELRTWLLPRVKREFHQRFSGRPFVITYDFDGVLWDIMGRVSQLVNLPYTMPELTHNYDIRHSPCFTDEEKHKIYQAFSDPDTFRQIQFFPGIENILWPEPQGAEVWINSDCYSEEIAVLKRRQLLAKIPSFNPDHLVFNVISPDQEPTKDLRSTCILVEDNPYTVLQSQAILNVMPETYDWTHNVATVDAFAGKQKAVLWRTDLNQITYTVHRIAQHVLS